MVLTIDALAQLTGRMPQLPRDRHSARMNKSSLQTHIGSNHALELGLPFDTHQRTASMKPLTCLTDEGCATSGSLLTGVACVIVRPQQHHASWHLCIDAAEATDQLCNRDSAAQRMLQQAVATCRWCSNCWCTLPVTLHRLPVRMCAGTWTVTSSSMVKSFAQYISSTCCLYVTTSLIPCL
jgi:hypothetical protein